MAGTPAGLAKVFGAELILAGNDRGSQGTVLVRTLSPG